MLLSNLDVLATAPGGVARLRELILTLAVQGKLVPQDPADEPASVLLQKIRAEKDRLMAEGKSKRDKPVAEIAEEEKPFGLPQGWEWVRLAALAEFENGDRGSNYPSRSNFVEHGVAFINAGHLVDERIDYSDMNYITPQNFALLRSGKVQRDDILYCLRGSLGKFAQVTENSPGAIASSLVIIRLSVAAVAPYAMQYLKSPLAASLIKRFDKALFALSIDELSTKGRCDELRRRNPVFEPCQEPLPGQIVGQVLGGDATQLAIQPALEA